MLTDVLPKLYPGITEKVFVMESREWTKLSFKVAEEEYMALKSQGPSKSGTYSRRNKGEMKLHPGLPMPPAKLS